MKKQKTKETLTQTIYDQRSILQRMKEIVTLPFFIIISALVSIGVMNLISVPILNLVLSDKELYTKLVSWAIVLLFALFIISRLISQMAFYIKTGLSPAVILSTIFKNRISSLFLFLFSIIVITGLIVCLFFLFKQNSIFIDTIFS